MRPRKIENKDELLSGCNKKEHRSIKDIMKFFGNAMNEKTEILPNVFSVFYGCNVSPLNIA